jgi:hypothetical protein
MEKLEPVPVVNGTAGTSPFDIEFYMLQGVGFRCMGYRDKNGKWRSALNHVELFGQIWICE